jgi:hypothetical protein
MTPDQFCYWLQGLLEMMPDLKTLDENQVAMVRAHLGYVFEHGHLDSVKRKQDMLEELSKRGIPVTPPAPAFIDPAFWPIPSTTGDKFEFPPRVIC